MIFREINIVIFIMYFNCVIEWEDKSFIFSIMIHSMGIKDNINGD